MYGAESCSKYYLSIERDFIRDWGVQLLKSNDKTFNDLDYKRRLLEMRPGSVPYAGWIPGINFEFMKIFREFQKYIANTDFAYMPSVLRFTNTGTDANNAIYELAEYAFFKRTGKQAKRPNLMYFGDPYGGTYGRVAEIGVRYETNLKIKKQFQVPTPYTDSLENHSKDETKRLEKIENKALEFIRKQSAKTSLEIGGIFLEPITTTKGLRFFRKEFLIKLRELADELNLPIIADEIFTGGGRTGTFWGFQNYGDFRPDLVTFGKGIGVSGIIEYTRSVVINDRIVSRWNWPSFENTTGESKKYPEAVFDNTSRVNPLQLLQSLQILKRIVNDDLPLNAKEVGAYALERMKYKLKSLGINDQIKGVGLLFDVGDKTDALVGKNGVSHYNGRWSPPLTMTKEEFNVLLDK